MAWKKSYDPRVHIHSQIKLGVFLLVLLAVIGLTAWGSSEYFNSQNPEVVEPVVVSQPLVDVAGPDEAPEIKPDIEPDANKIQGVVDAWAEENSGTKSVVVTGVDGEVLAEFNQDRVYFAASIYKLYVAYEGYRLVDQGELNPAADYINGNTLGECLDLMIRESDSPCGEKMMSEIGKQEIEANLVTYGLTNSRMSNITTSAGDAAIVLAKIYRGEGLSQPSRQAFLESMRTQIYRDALNKGFSNMSTVYNKIGFNEQLEYHDVAIVELQGGQAVIVSVLTSGVGSSNIAELGSDIEEVL